MADKPQYVTITKTCVGKLILTVTNPVTNLSTRIIMAANEPKRVLPLATAALVYVDSYSGAYRCYKAGYFTFSDPKAVYNYALEQGLIIGDESIIKQDAVIDEKYLEQMLIALKTGNRINIDKYLVTDKSKSDLVVVAREHFGELQQSTIKYLEEKLGLPLTVDGE